MPEGVDDLTGKEKEALRLLLAGHDAKSSAAELDISVHTLNDRLRAARRKLGVTSSREAARVLSEAEEAQTDPKNLVHTQIGMSDQAPSSDDPSIEPDTQESVSPRRWPRKGLIIMSTLICAAALGIAYVTMSSSAPEAAAPQTASSSAAPATAPSEPQALEWLALLDAGEIQASHMQAGSALRQRHSESLWELGVKLRLNKYGTPLRRELVSVTNTGERVGSGKGDYQVLVFKSDFLRAENVTEEVVMQREWGEWRVADYDMTKAGE